MSESTLDSLEFIFNNLEMFDFLDDILKLNV